MSWDTNIYNNPQKHGLTVVGNLSDPNACYTFNDLVVWLHDDGWVYYATARGCSCPSPFGDLNEMADLTLLSEKNWSAFVVEVRDHAVEWDDSDPGFQCDKNQLIAKVNALLRPPTRKEMDEAIAGLQRIAGSLPG